MEKQKYCEESYVDPDNQYYVKIENDVWICDGASILAGVTIGNGAVVAANALVTKDVPPYAIVAGVPAKIIGKRFEEEQINYLLSIKWWERDKKWLKNNCDLFADISTMMKELKKMSKKAIQKYLLYGELVCVLLMSCFFAYRILTFSNSEPMGYLLARLICFVFALLIILQNIKSKVTIWGPTFLAVSYVLIVTFNILIVTKTSINDFTDAALWPLLFLTAYEVTAQNCISEVHLFRILKITKIVCLGYSFVLVIEHILGIIPGTSEMFPTYVLLALVPFSLYEMDMEHGIKFNVIYLICTFLIMLMTSKRSCILVLAVGIMGYFLVKAKVQGRNVKAIVNRMAKYILTILVIFLAMYFVTKLMKLDIVERLNEMLNGDTNGRSAIWENVLEAFNASTLSEKLIGHGYHAFRFYKYSGYMYILNGNLAHNDYLNTLYDYGIIGVAVYASFLLSMIKELLLLIKKKSEIAPAFTFSIVLLGFLTFVSYFGIESRIINYVAIFWGYTLAIKRFDIKN